MIALPQVTQTGTVQPHRLDQRIRAGVETGTRALRELVDRVQLRCACAPRSRALLLATRSRSGLRRVSTEEDGNGTGSRDRRCGQAGAGVVDDLAGHGWDVVVFDRARRPDGPAAGTVFVPIDLTDYGQVLDAMLGRRGALRAGSTRSCTSPPFPAPGIVPDHADLRQQHERTWNVVSAARRAGVTNIVWASSETVLGLPFDTPPPYVPVDEEYPPRPESTYSLVKTMEETMAAQLCRWDPALKMIGLRFSNVMDPDDYARFPDFQDDATHAEVEPVGLHRRPRRRAGRPAGAGVAT